MVMRVIGCVGVAVIDRREWLWLLVMVLMVEAGTVE